MRLGGDDRGQSVQVGAVILFGFLVVALSTYQVTVVPQQNAEVEFGHSQDVREDMSLLRNSLGTAATTGASSSASVDLGTQFPSRTLFVNPPPATGQLRTETPDRENVSVRIGEDATFVGQPESEEALDYWGTEQNFSTTFLVYEPNYREYGGAGDNISIQNSHTFVSYPGGNTVNLTGSQLFQNNRTTIVLVRGDLSASGTDAVTVDAGAVSSISRPEKIDGWINLTIPTTMSANNVSGVLNVSGKPALYDVRPNGSNAVDVTIDGRETGIPLGIALVNAGSADDERPEFGYIDIESVRPDDTVQRGRVVEIEVEVRDRFGNPMPGETVAANDSLAGNGFFDDEGTTASDGTVVFQYDSGETQGTDTVQLNFSENLSVSQLGRQSTPGTSENASLNVTFSENPNNDNPDGGDDVASVEGGSWDDTAGNGNKAETLSFSLFNDEDKELFLRDITITDASKGSVEGVNDEEVDRNGEIVIDGVVRYDDGGRWNLNEKATLESSVKIEDEGSIGIEIGAFVNNGGNEVGMSGETVTLELVFEDESGTEYVQQVTIPSG